MNNINSRVEAGNHIITSLTKEDRAGLLPHLEPVSLQLSETLYEMDDPVDYIYSRLAAAGALQSLGLIGCQRGHITIVDVEGLRANTCECYEVVRKAFDKYLAA